jgi:hypothetical protein
MLKEYLNFLDKFDNDTKIKLLKLSFEKYDHKTFKSTRIYLFENIIRNKCNNYKIDCDYSLLLDKFNKYYQKNYIILDDYLKIIIKVFSE